jgi:Zn finger protein HypA/HybF involved in hydrogenase expression
MASYYDDNFGHYTIETEEDIEFYHEVQRQSVKTTCRQCDGVFMLKRGYDLCNRCADEMERGWY